MYAVMFSTSTKTFAIYYTAYYYVFILCVVPLVHEPVPSVTLKFLRTLHTISDPTAECSHYIAELNYFNKTNYPSLITYTSERTSSRNIQISRRLSRILRLRNGGFQPKSNFVSRPNLIFTPRFE